MEWEVVPRILTKVPSVKNFKVKEYFYEKLVFNWDALGGIVDGYEIDIYIPSRKIGIEYFDNNCAPIYGQ